MTQLVREGFVLSDGCVFSDLGEGYILLEGRIECADGTLYIDVFKLLRILSGDGANAVVQTQEYSYNAVFRGRGNVFRYDSPHPHKPEHHVHRYDVLGDPRVETINDVRNEEDRPTLGEVIIELRDWYYTNFDQIEQVRRDIDAAREKGL